MARQQDTGVADAAVRRYWREQDARLVVEAWRKSGLSMAEFAKRHGVHLKRLSRWARRLQSTAPAMFHPVQLIRHERSVEGADTRIEVVLSSGCSIRVPQGFVAADLRQVVDVLEGRS